MSAAHADKITARQPPGSLAASETTALGFLPEEDDDDDNGVPIPELPSPPSPNYDPPTHRVRSDYEYQVEKNRRLDEVEPGLSQFCEQRGLHKRQLADLEKKTVMVTERLDKLTADVEKLRQQWGDLEREKAKLTEAQQSWQQKMAAQQKVIHKDDVIAQKYQDYIELDEEVLVLDDSEDDDGDELMYDWQAQGQGGGEDEEQQEEQ